MEKFWWDAKVRVFETIFARKFIKLVKFLSFNLKTI
jgi:hypothetical protein